MPGAKEREKVKNEFMASGNSSNPLPLSSWTYPPPPKRATERSELPAPDVLSLPQTIRPSTSQPSYSDSSLQNNSRSYPYILTGHPRPPTHIRSNQAYYPVQPGSYQSNSGTPSGYGLLNTLPAANHTISLSTSQSTQSSYLQARSPPAPRPVTQPRQTFDLSAYSNLPASPLVSGLTTGLRDRSTVSMPVRYINDSPISVSMPQSNVPTPPNVYLPSSAAMPPTVRKRTLVSPPIARPLLTTPQPSKTLQQPEIAHTKSQNLKPQDISRNPLPRGVEFLAAEPKAPASNVCQKSSGLLSQKDPNNILESSKNLLCHQGSPCDKSIEADKHVINDGRSPVETEIKSADETDTNKFQRTEENDVIIIDADSTYEKNQSDNARVENGEHENDEQIGGNSEHIDESVEQTDENSANAGMDSDEIDENVEPRDNISSPDKNLEPAEEMVSDVEMVEPVGDISAGEISGGEISAGEISAGEIEAGDNILSGDISAGEMSAGEMSVGEIPAVEISAGEISAGEISSGVSSDESEPDWTDVDETGESSDSSLVETVHSSDVGDGSEVESEHADEKSVSPSEEYSGQVGKSTSNPEETGLLSVDPPSSCRNKQSPVTEKSVFEPANHTLQTEAHAAKLDQPMSLSDQPMPQSDQHTSQSDQPMMHSDQHISPSDQHMSQSDQHMLQSDQHMSQPGQAMPQSDQHMSQSDQHMPQLDKHTSQSDQHMSQSDQHISPSDQPMTQSDQLMSQSDQHMPQSDQPMSQSNNSNLKAVSEQHVVQSETQQFVQENSPVETETSLKPRNIGSHDPTGAKTESESHTQVVNEPIPSMSLSTSSTSPLQIATEIGESKPTSNVPSKCDSNVDQVMVAGEVLKLSENTEPKPKTQPSIPVSTTAVIPRKTCTARKSIRRSRPTSTVACPVRNTLSYQASTVPSSDSHSLVATSSSPSKPSGSVPSTADHTSASNLAKSRTSVVATRLPSIKSPVAPSDSRITIIATRPPSKRLAGQQVSQQAGQQVGQDGSEERKSIDDRETLPLCRNGHALVRQPISDGWDCDILSMKCGGCASGFINKNPKRIGRFRCEKCNFDACQPCYDDAKLSANVYDGDDAYDDPSASFSSSQPPLKRRRTSPRKHARIKYDVGGEIPPTFPENSGNVEFSEDLVKPEMEISSAPSETQESWETKRTELIGNVRTSQFREKYRDLFEKGRTAVRYLLTKVAVSGDAVNVPKRFRFPVMKTGGREGYGSIYEEIGFTQRAKSKPGSKMYHTWDDPYKIRLEVQNALEKHMHVLGLPKKRPATQQSARSGPLPTMPPASQSCDPTPQSSSTSSSSRTTVQLALEMLKDAAPYANLMLEENSGLRWLRGELEAGRLAGKKKFLTPPEFRFPRISMKTDETGRKHYSGYVDGFKCLGLMHSPSETQSNRHYFTLDEFDPEIAKLVLQWLDDRAKSDAANLNGPEQERSSPSQPSSSSKRKPTETPKLEPKSKRTRNTATSSTVATGSVPATGSAAATGSSDVPCDVDNIESLRVLLKKHLTSWKNKLKNAESRLVQNTHETRQKEDEIREKQAELAALKAERVKIRREISTARKEINENQEK
eukprot:1012293_1